MPEFLNPLVIQETEELAAELAARFTPPEFYPGCQVKDVTDADLYDTDNGWVEAIVSHHNQQRVRYRGDPPDVGTADFVDVIHFPNRKLFEVYGQGGTAQPRFSGSSSTLVDPDDGSISWEVTSAENLVNTGGGGILLDNSAVYFDSGLAYDYVYSPSTGNIDVVVESGGGNKTALRIDEDGLLLPLSGLDIKPDGDDIGLYNRFINSGQTPLEHWRNGVEAATWTGYASYTGFTNSPSSTSISSSVLRIGHSSSAKAFRYRSFVNAQTTLYARVGIGVGQARAGLMVDDGANNADGNGANNFIRIFFDSTSTLSSLYQIIVQKRTGGTGVTSTTYYTTALRPDPIILFLTYGVGTRWSNWGFTAGMVNEFGVVTLENGLASAYSYTPARVGIYFENLAAAAGRQGVYDWYDEV